VTEADHRPLLQIIVASTRPGRVGEPEHPRFARYTLDSTRAFSAMIARADAFAIVHQEYNHSYNAARKNALDHLNTEWSGKPIALIGYGGVAAGARAAEALWPVLVALRIVPVAATVPSPLAGKNVSGEGDMRTFTPAAETEAGAEAALDGLTEWLGTLGLRGTR